MRWGAEKKIGYTGGRLTHMNLRVKISINSLAEKQIEKLQGNYVGTRDFSPDETHRNFRTEVPGSENDKHLFSAHFTLIYDSFRHTCEPISSVF